jgi:hypothetical protein
LAGKAEEEAGAIRAVRNGFQFRHQKCWAFAIKGPPIGIHHRCHVEGALVSPFYLERIDACIHQSIQMGKHAEVMGAHEVAAAPVFFEWKGLTRPGCLG